MAETNRAAIEQRAHKIWIAKGRRDGHALEDWAQAEVELRAEAARAGMPTGAASKPAGAASKPTGTASKPAGAAFGGNLASATGAAPKGGVVAGPKGAAFPAAGSAKSPFPAAGSAPTVAAPSGTSPMKNGNRPSPKNGKGKKR